MKDRVGSSDENDDADESEVEDEDDPLVVINKWKKSSFTQELAGLNGNLWSAWDAPTGSHRRRNWTDYHCWRCGRLDIESAVAN